MLGCAVGAEEHLEEKEKCSQGTGVALTTKYLEKYNKFNMIPNVTVVHVCSQ